MSCARILYLVSFFEASEYINKFSIFVFVFFSFVMYRFLNYFCVNTLHLQFILKLYLKYSHENKNNFPVNP